MSNLLFFLLHTDVLVAHVMMSDSQVNVNEGITNEEVAESDKRVSELLDDKDLQYAT